MYCRSDLRQFRELSESLLVCLSYLSGEPNVDSAKIKQFESELANQKTTGRPKKSLKPVIYEARRFYEQQESLVLGQRYVENATLGDFYNRRSARISIKWFEDEDVNKYKSFEFEFKNFTN